MAVDEILYNVVIRISSSLFLESNKIAISCNAVCCLVDDDISNVSVLCPANFKALFLKIPFINTCT
ncbi:hypothetical protein Leryth_025219 [Lithospermum erythrorhizon]|nr:hypothetical protein Leryth_025219 [Lithospermum erythrorhizon]